MTPIIVAYAEAGYIAINRITSICENHIKVNTIFKQFSGLKLLTFVVIILRQKLTNDWRKMQVVCVKCKKEMPDRSTFCPWCGKKQAREPRKALKRANGMGSAYKLTAPRLRRPWVASKSKVVLGYYATKTDALTALEAVSKRDLTERYNMTFEDAYNAWSDEHFRSVGEKGEEAYKNAFKNHATMLYNRKMRDLRTADYQEAIDTLDKAGKSRSTIEKLQQLFGQLSRWAVREEISTTDFAQFVKLPQREKAEKETFSEGEIQTLFNLIYTGVRIGELFCVPKSDVDIQGGYMIGGEKTKAGRAIESLHSRTVFLAT